MVPPAFGPDAACMAQVLWVLVWGTHLKQDEGLKHLNMLEGEGLPRLHPPLVSEEEVVLDPDLRARASSHAGQLRFPSETRLAVGHSYFMKETFRCDIHYPPLGQKPH